MLHPGEFHNMNFPAPIAVLGFLAAIAGLILSTLAILALVFFRKAQWAQRLGALVMACVTVYFALLFGMSLASHEVTLAPGQEKYFCEIDCHLAYSVVASREEFQDGQQQLQVTLRTRFDENTISPQRPKDAPLTPNPRRVRLLDSQGRVFDPFATTGSSLMRSLIPGASYETQLIFRVPADATQLRLLLESSGWEEHFLIGGENSLGHKKTYFAVPARS